MFLHRPATTADAAGRDVTVTMSTCHSDAGTEVMDRSTDGTDSWNLLDVATPSPPQWTVYQASTRVTGIRHKHGLQNTKTLKRIFMLQ